MESTGHAPYVPMYLQIEQDLMDAIETGQIKVHDQVPSEAELSAKYSVSRMTARKALDRLTSNGVLFRQPGKGTFVSAPKIAHRLSTQFSFSAAMEARGLRHETKVLQAGIIAAPSVIQNALKLPHGMQVVFIQRLRVVEDVPAAIHSTYLPIRFAAVLHEDLTQPFSQLIEKLGIRVDAIGSQDAIEAVVATSEEAALLGISKGAPLLRVHGIGATATQEPWRYTEALYRGDRFYFTADTVGVLNLHPDIVDRTTTSGLLNTV